MNPLQGLRPSITKEIRLAITNAGEPITAHAIMRDINERRDWIDRNVGIDTVKRHLTALVQLGEVKKVHDIRKPKWTYYTRVIQ